jgi:Domain of unknown function (DUF1977)
MASAASAGMMHILAILALLIVTLFSQSSSPAAQLQPDGKFRHVMYTRQREVPYYVSQVDKFESQYPRNSLNRQQLERQV